MNIYLQLLFYYYYCIIFNVITRNNVYSTATERDYLCTYISDCGRTT